MKKTICILIIFMLLMVLAACDWQGVTNGSVNVGTPDPNAQFPPCISYPPPPNEPPCNWYGPTPEGN